LIVNPWVKAAKAGTTHAFCSVISGPFDVLPNGLVAMETSRIFADLSGPEPVVPDGMKIDTASNV
jgi:hypothetical protein